MALRDIKNYLDQVVGQLELPDDTSDEVWARELAIYARPPAAQPIPDVTPRQIRQALVLSGVSLASIDAAIDTLPEPTKSLVRIEWEYSVAFIRTNPLVAQVGAIIGWTSDQLDALWRFAKTL